jgi:regulator of sigma E protease
MSWLYVFLGFSALVILHEAGHFFAAKATGMRVERFFLFLGPKLVSIKRGETEYGIAAIPIGGFVKISGMHPEDELPPGEEHRGYYEQPVWKRVVVIGAGPAVNILLAFLIFFSVALVDAQDGTQVVGEVVAGTPAAKSLKPGDRILAVDGKAYPYLPQEARLGKFIDQIASHKCTGKAADGCLTVSPVILRIEREGRLQTISAAPEYDAAIGGTRLGFLFKGIPAELSLQGAAGRALDTMWTVTRETGKVIGNIFKAKERKQVSGVVGISSVANQAIGLGLAPALLLLALVSLSLGLFNLLPFLPLDGGHIFWSLIEKLRGRPVSWSVMERASVVGFALVAMLMLIGFTNDIGRLTGEGFNVR